MNLVREMLHKNMFLSDVDVLSLMVYAKRTLDLLKEMHHIGQPANVVTYTSLLDGLCKNQNLHKATALFMKMKEWGIQPDKYTYTALIDGHLIIICNI